MSSLNLSLSRLIRITLVALKAFVSRQHRFYVRHLGGELFGKALLNHSTARLLQVQYHLLVEDGQLQECVLSQFIFEDLDRRPERLARNASGHFKYLQWVRGGRQRSRLYHMYHTVVPYVKFTIFKL